MLRFFIIFFLFNGSLGQAEEVDDFTPIKNHPRDAAPIIDLATNALFQELIRVLNESKLPSCSDPQKYQLAIKKFDQNFTGIGNGLRAGKELKILLQSIANDPQRRLLYQKRLNTVQNTWLSEFAPEKRDWFSNLFASVEYFGPRENRSSIYEGLDFLTCCTSRINVNETYIGLDKIDHFFGNAGLLYEQYLTMDSALPQTTRLEQLMAISVNQEHSLWGLKGLSPKSYGDLAANWQGVYFYRHLFDESPSYIECKDGHFELNRQHSFTIKDYVDEAWNESTNCSSFISHSDLDKFNRNLLKAGMTCPRDINLCQELIKKHANDPLFLKYSLSPLCTGSPAHFTAVEEAVPITWAEAGLSFRGFTTPIIKELLLNKGVEILKNLIPTFLLNPEVTEGKRIFTELQRCRESNAIQRYECIKRFTEPHLTSEQISKFSTFLSEGVDFESITQCPSNSEALEARLHPVPIGDVSLCFTTHYRNRATIGRIYFRRYENDLKVVLFRL